MDEDHENNAELEAKRRKIRKGTKSCWECRRRKMKCMYAGSPTDIEATCIACERRGTKCVSQEFDLGEAEENSVRLKRKRGHDTSSQDPIARVEALVEQLMKRVGGDGTPVNGETHTNSDNSGIPTPNHDIPTPVSIDSDSSRFLSLYKPSDDHSSVENERKYAKLSQSLYESLPSREDMEMICKARSDRSILSHEILSTPYNALEQNGLKLPESLLEIPGPDLHPILIARYMLSVATFLQHLHPNSLEGVAGLSESPYVIMERLSGTAIGLVTTNEELFGSIESLECVMIESLYQANSGNLRRSWVAIRRAMVIAQLMNLHRSGSQAQYKVLDPRTRADPHFMWFRIVFHDRHLCLMLGLTQGSLDRSMATGAVFRNDTPMGRLERMHCTLACRILERNEFNPSSHDFTLTQDLDMELQRAAKSLPSKFWLTPNLTSVAEDPQALFWEMGRLFNQLFHYNLLNQLHLPYMIRSSPERKYEYSRMACVNASREVLSRFIMFRGFNQNAFCCRTVDFFALMAAITLLLAHLDSHRSSPSGNFLAHQNLSDRAMIEQAQKNMEEISCMNGDALSAQSADLLGRLLSIEAETADGLSTESVSLYTSESEMVRADKDDNGVVRVQIPYFGIVKIARQGVVFKEMANPQPAASNGQSKGSVIGMSSPSISEGAVRSFGFDSLGESYLPGSMAEASHSSVNGINDLATHFTPQFSDANSLSLPEQYEYPLLTAGVDDWAFQGVDMAFFGNLMKGAEDDERSGEI